jgi:hypothetical protein
VRHFLFEGPALTAVEIAAMLADWAALAPRGRSVHPPRRRGAPAGSAPLLGCAALLPVGAAACSALRLAGEVERLAVLAKPHWACGFAREALAALVAADFAPDGEAPVPAHPFGCSGWRRSGVLRPRPIVHFLRLLEAEVPQGGAVHPPDVVPRPGVCLLAHDLRQAPIPAQGADQGAA